MNVVALMMVFMFALGFGVTLIFLLIDWLIDRYVFKGDNT